MQPTHHEISGTVTGAWEDRSDPGEIIVTMALDRPVTTVPEAARVLQIPPSTLRAWLDGAERLGRRSEPVLREAATGSNLVTWGEMVEARYLRAYRAAVSMQRLRPFLAQMREEFGVPYPLAHFRPFVDASRGLVFRLQEAADLPDELWMVYRGRGNQLRLSPTVVNDFLHHVEFAAEGALEALRIRPAGLHSGVVIDPAIHSGAPSVLGVRTARLAERAEGFGQTPDELAREFGLDVSDVKAAIAYEFAA